MNQYTHLTWTDERIEIVRKLWSEGRSASYIANHIGGVTRNAVIGKVHRLRLSGRATCSRVKKHRPKRADHRPVIVTPSIQKPRLPRVFFETAPLPSPSEPLASAPLVTFEELEADHCRWMHGDRYCGCKRVPGIPYCADHARVAFRPPQPATVRDFVRLQRMGNGVIA